LNLKKLKTKYAPAERLSNEEVKHQIKIFKDNDVLNKFLSKIPAIFLVVNKYRQIVYMNKGALEFTGLEDVTEILGERPGEVFACIHSSEEEGGCGTSEACNYCGAVNAVLSSLKGNNAMLDCRLILGPDENSFDLRVWASPLSFMNELFSAVTIQDIKHEKRRAFLERIFFHDILNSITGLLGSVEILLKHSKSINQEEYLKKLDGLAKNLIEEIQSQQILNAAENNALSLKVSTFNSIDFLKEMVDLYVSHGSAINRNIKIDENAEMVEITSDRALLRRILGNMLINALEATPMDETITLGCKVVNKYVQLWVHNPNFIPREVQLQIFQRSYSTKGPNRGLGTYSMKLLSSVLNGTIVFSTSEDKGTTFMACYPLKKK
jgi:signal transduction histidine kinase